MPATSLSGDCFARRCARPRGFAFEVEDDVVAAGTKDLAEMIVAVDADALACLGGVCRGEQARSLQEFDAAAR